MDKIKLSFSLVERKLTMNMSPGDALQRIPPVLSRCLEKPSSGAHTHSTTVCSRRGKANLYSAVGKIRTATASLKVGPGTDGKGVCENCVGWWHFTPR